MILEHIKYFFLKLLLVDPPEKAPPLTEAEKAMAQEALDEMERSGEIDLSQFCR
jgi:hypothetical protein